MHDERGVREPTNRGSPIPEWDQCDAAAVRFGVAHIESESESEVARRLRRRV